MRGTGCPHGLGEFCFDVISLLREFRDVAERIGVGRVELCGVDGLRPLFERGCPFCSGFPHTVLARARLDVDHLGTVPDLNPIVNIC